MANNEALEQLKQIKHSGHGIISFLISLLPLLLGIVSLTISSFNPSLGKREFSVPGLFVFLSMRFTLSIPLALAFGIVGIRQKNRKKMFAKLGLSIVSIYILIWLAALIVVIIRLF